MGQVHRERLCSVSWTGKLLPNCGASGIVAAFLVLVSCSSTVDVEESIARGAILYVEHCQNCHGDYYGAGKRPEAPYHGPSGHTVLHADSVLEALILEGMPRGSSPLAGSDGPGSGHLRMPAWKGVLSIEEVRDILKYLKTWWTPEQCAMRVARFGEDEGSC